MTREEIKNTPEIVDYLVSESLIPESKEKLHKRLDVICNLAVKALKQEPKTGHWITKIKSDLIGDMWPTNPKCSECGGEPYFSNTIYNYKFCPYCGAKMGVEE